MAFVLEEPDGLVDGVDDAFEIFVDLLMTEAKHGDAEIYKDRIAAGVLDCVMERTVNFDSKFQRDAIIVREERTDGMLAAEGRAKRRIAQVWPEFAFGLRDVVAQFARADGLAF